MLSRDFGKKWDHTLKISDVFADAGDLPEASETVAMGAEIITRIKALQSKLRDTSDLYRDLDNCIETFEELEGIENAYEARARFNDALGSLYDQGDAGKRIWIE